MRARARACVCACVWARACVACARVPESERESVVKTISSSRKIACECSRDEKTCQRMPRVTRYVALPRVALAHVINTLLWRQAGHTGRSRRGPG